MITIDSRLSFLLQEISSLRQSLELTSPLETWLTISTQKRLKVVHAREISQESLTADALVVETKPDRIRGSWATLLQKRFVPLAFLKFRIIGYDDLSHEDLEGIRITITATFKRVALNVTIEDSATPLDAEHQTPSGEPLPYLRHLLSNSLNEALSEALSQYQANELSQPEKERQDAAWRSALSKAREGCRVALRSYRDDAARLINNASNISKLKSSLQIIENDLSNRITRIVESYKITEIRVDAGSKVDEQTIALQPAWQKKLDLQALGANVVVGAITSFWVIPLRQIVATLPALFEGSRLRREDAQTLIETIDREIQSTLQKIDHSFDKVLSGPRPPSDNERRLALTIGRARKLKSVLTP